MDEQFVSQLALVAGLITLGYLGVWTVKKTKRNRKIGVFGATAKLIDSYVSSHQANLNEMQTVIEHEIKKVDPQDK